MRTTSLRVTMTLAGALLLVVALSACSGSAPGKGAASSADATATSGAVDASSTQTALGIPVRSLKELWRQDKYKYDGERTLEVRWDYGFSLDGQYAMSTYPALFDAATGTYVKSGDDGAKLTAQGIQTSELGMTKVLSRIRDDLPVVTSQDAERALAARQSAERESMTMSFTQAMLLKGEVVAQSADSSPVKGLSVRITESSSNPGYAFVQANGGVFTKEPGMKALKSSGVVAMFGLCEVSTGKVVWSRRISSQDPDAASVVRTTNGPFVLLPDGRVWQNDTVWAPDKKNDIHLQGLHDGGGHFFGTFGATTIYDAAPTPWYGEPHYWVIFNGTEFYAVMSPEDTELAAVDSTGTRIIVVPRAGVGDWAWAVLQVE